jgi:phage baseplate assembly protein gpV
MADNRSTIHQGQTTERNVNSATARVGFDDLNGTVSGYMQILFPAAGGWNFFYTPKEGDQVVVSRLPNGTEEGYILGKVYTAGKMPQGGAPNIILLVSDDGKNIVRFDADKGTLDLVCDQNGTLKFKNLDIEIKEHTHIKTKTFHMEVEESRKIEVGENVDITVGGNVSTEIGGNIDTTIDGNVVTEVGGNIDTVVDGNVGISISGNETTNVDGSITEIAGGTNTNKGATVQHN